MNKKGINGILRMIDVDSITKYIMQILSLFN